LVWRTFDFDTALLQKNTTERGERVSVQKFGSFESKRKKDKESKNGKIVELSKEENTVFVSKIVNDKLFSRGKKYGFCFYKRAISRNISELV
jgi:hypothetical protein